MNKHIFHASSTFLTRVDIFDPSAVIIKFFLKFYSILNASSQLGAASNFTLKYKSYFDDASSPLGDASKMQLCPQWLTIITGVQQHVMKITAQKNNIAVHFTYYYYYKNQARSIDSL